MKIPKIGDLTEDGMIRINDDHDGKVMRFATRGVVLVTIDVAKRAAVFGWCVTDADGSELVSVRR